MRLETVLRSILGVAVLGALASCSMVRHEQVPQAVPASPAAHPAPAAAPPTSWPPGNAPPPPADVLSIPDAVPHWEPRSRYGNPRSYDVLGQRYYVNISSNGYVERGVASWYGPGFHAVRTSIGESYDMYAMTAAHKTLPLPTYVRVTNLENGRTVVVRVNDRGPFVSNRIIDLSYTAAAKLDMLRKGTAIVEVRAIDLTDVVSSPIAPATVDTKAQPPAVFGNGAPVIVPGTDAPPATASAASPSPGAPFTSAPTPIAPTIAPATAPSATSPPASAAPPTATGSTAAPSSAAPAAAPSAAAPFKKKPLFMQAGAFSARANAESLAAKLRRGKFASVSVRGAKVKGKTLYRVRIGPIGSVPEFDRVAAALEHAGVHDAQIALD